jgi:solute carrier family 34 (sodium-dependent phosphate cotransporter)
MGELERGVAAAAVHSLFNFLTVAVLFPVELAFGYLQAVSRVLVNTAETGGKDDAYVGPIKRIVHPLVDVIIMSNSKLITGVARGKTCEDFYPIECDPDVDPSYKTCKTGLIGCNKESGRYDQTGETTHLPCENARLTLAFPLLLQVSGVFSRGRYSV